MFTGIILICSALGSTDCQTMSGPAFETKEECKYNMRTVGIPTVRTNYPDQIIVGQRCIRWKNDKGA